VILESKDGHTLELREGGPGIFFDDVREHTNEEGGEMAKEWMEFV